MRKFIIAAALIAVAFAAPSASRAQDKSDKVEMIPISRAAELLAALGQLGGGHDEIVGQGASQRAVSVPYNFGPDTLWAITDDMTALRKIVVSYQTTVKQLNDQAEAKNGGPLKPDSPEQKSFNESVQKLFDSSKPVEKLFHIKRADLKLGENKIPPAVLSSLSPIIDP